MPRFIETLRPTSFGYYDSDPLFQNEADAVVTFVASRLGDNILSVELTKKMIWRNFEEATMALNGYLVEYQAKSNLASLLGMPTASFNPDTGIPTINLTNVYIQQNLAWLQDMASPYAAAIGWSSDQESYSGSIDLREGVQDYDLYTELRNEAGTPLYDLQPSGSVTKLSVYEVFHNAPVFGVLSSNLATNFANIGMPLESYTADTRFHMLPIFEDVLRAGMMKEATKIRRSHYSYRISGRMIRIFPIPRSTANSPAKIWLRVGFRQNPLPNMAANLLTQGTNQTIIGAGTGAGFQNDTVFGVNSPFNLPYGPVSYRNLNIWARNWVFQYTLAVCTEQLGRVRSKFKSFPYAQQNLQLNGEDLVSQGREDKQKLSEAMKEQLESLTFDKLAEREAAKAEAMVKQLAFIPVNPKYAIFMA